MRRSSEPEERAQFTVAELLARHGEPPPSGRRRRRAADDSAADNGAGVAGPGAVDTTTVDTTAQPLVAAAQPLVEHNWTGGREPSGSWPLSEPPSRHDLPRHGSSSSARNGRGDREWKPAVEAPPSVFAGRASPVSPPPVTPSVVPKRIPLTPTALSGGPATDQLPQQDPAPMDSAGWLNGRSGNSTAARAYGGPAQAPAGLGGADRAIPEQHEPAAASGAEQVQESGSALWQWAVMVSQVGIGMVGGAALWLICEWFWQRIPVVALAVALVVIAGLVWIVRRVRRAEDFQTTVVAVLVGLFITVSPAALLLVGR